MAQAITFGWAVLVVDAFGVDDDTAEVIEALAVVDVAAGFVGGCVRLLTFPAEAHWGGNAFAQ